MVRIVLGLVSLVDIFVGLVVVVVVAGFLYAGGDPTGLIFVSVSQLELEVPQLLLVYLLLRDDLIDLVLYLRDLVLARREFADHVVRYQFSNVNTVLVRHLYLHLCPLPHLEIKF